MEQFLDEFISTVIDMKLTSNNLNILFKLFMNFNVHMRRFNTCLLQESNNFSEILEMTTDFVQNKFFDVSTAHNRNKKCSKHSIYVKPKEIAIGTRWEMQRVKSKGKRMCIPRLVQNSFYVISVAETLRALFGQEEFREMYMNYNSNRSHSYTEGTYIHFCCTKTFQESELFKLHPNSIQIQLSYDDFGICNPLGAKANRHQTGALYMSINNLPPQYLSKRSNIYLVGIFNANDTKTKETDFNNIWNGIIGDLQFLETVGIDIDNNINLKGTLTSLAFDNLGANTALGFSGGFNAANFCRICKATKQECQHLTKIEDSMYRT